MPVQSVQSVQAPTFTDVLRARALLANHLPPTPMWSYPALDEDLGATVHVKHDNVQPTGAFKVRGGVTLLAGMAAAERSRGMLTYSTGNHAQSIAYAARLFGASCTVVMPEDADEGKARAVRSLGASVVLHGARLEDAREQAEALAARHGMRLVSPGGEPALVAGVATAYLEVLESAPDLDAIFVPVGSGSGAAAACLVAAAVAPGCRVIGVQSDGSPAAWESWRAGACMPRPNHSRVEGLATGDGFELTQAVMREHLTDFVLVSDEEIHCAQRLLLTHAHTLAEGAGAAALAGLLRLRANWAGARVAVACTGGNASTDEIAASLRTDSPVPA